MTNELFAVENIKDENGNILHLNYFLLSARFQSYSGVEVNAYGIEILKYINNVFKDAETIPNISEDKAFVENILNKVSKGDVMPSTLVYIIDDIVS